MSTREASSSSDQASRTPNRALQSQKQQQAQSQQVWYRAFKPEIDSVAYDPLDPSKRYHKGIFIETDPAAGKGTLFNVTGDIIRAGGMIYEEKHDFVPGSPARLHNTTHIGWVSKADHDSGRVGSVLRALPKPTKQQGINFWEKNPVTGRYDMIWTKENGDRYEPGEQRRPTFKCNEWTNLYAIPALRNAGILRDST